jgi:hypothetical protein
MKLKLKSRFYLMLIIALILMSLLPFFLGCGKNDPVLGGLYCQYSYSFYSTTQSQCESYKVSRDCSKMTWSSSNRDCYVSECCNN